MAKPISTEIYQCNKEAGTYDPNSPFKTNLLTTLKILAEESKKEKIPKEKGFSLAFAGDKLDEEVTAIALCAGYIEAKECVSCVSSTIPLLLQKCTNQKKGMAWREICMVRYEAFSIHNPDTWVVTNETSEAKVKDAAALEKALNQFVENSMKKLYENNPAGYAFGTQPYGSPSQELFVVMQCALDIASRECDKCLLHIAKEMKPCCIGASDAIVVTPNCYMRKSRNRIGEVKNS
ncbi:hypothetical protein QVD17_17966 [Tagetes erecta]|uniref:Gnk2-homologous domain-containing protein n=1 Tax=Tagetes erecta TaxID=13708 RepID=A0AAD8KN92_TARER|nr:hypothetical protein QVD17_17966 [Tagetes erecta]